MTRERIWDACCEGATDETADIAISEAPIQSKLDISLELDIKSSDVRLQLRLYRLLCVLR